VNCYEVKGVIEDIIKDCKKRLFDNLEKSLREKLRGVLQ
jgi:hypothetical protein